MTKCDMKHTHTGRERVSEGKQTNEHEGEAMS